MGLAFWSFVVPTAVIIGICGNKARKSPSHTDTRKNRKFWWYMVAVALNVLVSIVVLWVTGQLLGALASAACCTLVIMLGDHIATQQINESAKKKGEEEDEDES